MLSFLHTIILYVQNSVTWRRQFIAFICGGLTAFALNPFNLIFIGFITFPILVILLGEIAAITSIKSRLYLAALTMWSFGFGYFVSALWWLGSALLIGPWALILAMPFAIFGLPAYLALYWGMAGLILMFFWQKNVIRFIVLAVSLGFFEYLRGVLFTGFPWAAIGYTIMPTPLFMQISAFFGLNIMNIWAVLLYTLPVGLFCKKQRVFSVLIGFSLILFQLGFGFYRLHNSYEQVKNMPQYSVRIVQPSIDQSTKLDAEERQYIFEKLLNLSLTPIATGQKRPDFIVWPETSVPYILDYAPRAKARIAAILEKDQWAIVGTIRLDESSNQDGSKEKGKRFFNSIEVINSAGQVLHASDKLHLVPFGEYLPFEKLFNTIGLRGVAEVVGGYSAGNKRHTVNMPNGFTYLPLICYEIIFPQDLHYNGKIPQAILNVTNDAWFGITPGPYQHFQQARLRAVEQGLPLIRAANNGISAVVDSYGQIIAFLPQNAVGVLDVLIPLPNVSNWNVGPYFFHILNLGTLLFLLIFRMYRSKE